MKTHEVYCLKQKEKALPSNSMNKEIKMRYILGIICFLTIGHAAATKHCQPCPSWWQKGWAATLYSGPLTTEDSSKFVTNFKFENSAIVALAGSKKLFNVWNNKLDFELEAQVVQHVGDQKHFEINPIVLIARWNCFPWNRTLPTTFAIGDGLSIVTEKPKLEHKRRPHKSSDQVLNYVMAELTLSLPEIPQWALVARYHHRSGMFGVFHEVHDASTVLAAGIKYWF